MIREVTFFLKILTRNGRKYTEDKDKKRNEDGEVSLPLIDTWGQTSPHPS